MRDDQVVPPLVYAGLLLVTVAGHVVIACFSPFCMRSVSKSLIVIFALSCNVVVAVLVTCREGLIERSRCVS